MAPRSTQTSGMLYTLGAYLLWGILPLYFMLLNPATPWEIVAVRILFSLVFCALLLSVMRGGWKRFVAIVRDRRLLLLLGLSGLLIYINWQVFVIGALTGHIVETSLGYFINPIVTVALGVIVLRERLRPLQWVAVGIAGLAVVVLVVGYGKVPWISLALALSFGFYALVKSRVGSRVDAVSGLTIETLWLVPIAVVQLIVVGMSSALTFGSLGPAHTGWLMLAGVVTAVPFLLFASGARRLPLSLVGILQFVAPIMQLIIGIQHEPMPIERWIGFGVVWLAVLVFILDILIASRRKNAQLKSA